jgi:DNA-binding MarR family transcriptional regulator
MHQRIHYAQKWCVQVGSIGSRMLELPKAKKIAENAPIPSAKQHRFGYVVHDVSRMRRVVMDHAVAPLGLTRSQWSTLSMLSRSERNGMMQAEIARLMDVGKVTIGGLVRRLEAAGLVERRSDDSDKRLKLVFITDKGYEVIRTMIDLADDLNNDILTGISDDERELAENTLVKVRENLKQMIAKNRRDRQVANGK